MSSTVAIALGSNLGDRAHTLRRAVDELRKIVHLVRVSAFRETEPVDAPPGSPRFLNAVAVGYTTLAPLELLDALQSIEAKLGRRRTRVRNAPRPIDLDLIFHSANRARTKRLTLPHPRYRQREFVLQPLREIWTGPSLPGVRYSDVGNATASPRPRPVPHADARGPASGRC